MEMEENVNILKKLNTLRKEDDFCDVTLVVENIPFPCHRVVLASRCSYFYTMFKNFKEKDSEEVILKGLSSKGFEGILCYIYTNEIEIKQDNVKNLLIASDMFGLEKLQDSCIKFMENVDVLDDLVDLLIYFDLHDNAKLVRKLQGFICDKFSDICDNGSVVDLNYDQLKSILTCEDLTVEKEETVFDGVLKWIKYDEERRLNHMGDLLPLIKVPSVISPYMVDVQLNEPIIQNNTKYRDMILKCSISSSYKTYLKPKKVIQEPRFMFFTRKVLEGSTIVPEIYNFNGYSFLEIFPGLSFKTSYLQSVAFNKNTAFVLWENEENKVEFQKIDIDAKECINLKPPPSIGKYYTLQTDGERIYLYIQSSVGNLRTKFYFYDLQLDIWVEMPDFNMDNTQIDGSCFRVHQRKLYSIGGYVGACSDNSINKFYSFDLRENDWKPMPDMPN